MNMNPKDSKAAPKADESANLTAAEKAQQVEKEARIAMLVGSVKALTGMHIDPLAQAANAIAEKVNSLTIRNENVKNNVSTEYKGPGLTQ